MFLTVEIERILIIFGILLILVFIYYFSLILIQRASDKTEQEHKFYSTSSKPEIQDHSKLFSPGNKS